MLKRLGLKALIFVFVRGLDRLESPLLSAAWATRLAHVAGDGERTGQQMAPRGIAACYYGLPKIGEGALFAILVQNGPVRGVQAGDRIWLLLNLAASTGSELAAAACMEGRRATSPYWLRVEFVGELRLRPVRCS